jgi:aminoglycoside 6'-N-acetyltransferase
VRTLRILHVRDCPNVRLLAERLGIALRDHRDIVVTWQVIDTVEAATTEGMNGSPTLLVDGVDPFAEPGQQPSLSCPLHREDGRPGGVPSVRSLRRAVGRATRPDADFREGAMTELEGRIMRLRPARQDDAEAFRQILGHPEVARWWGDPDQQLDEVLTEEQGISTYAIEHDGMTVGLIQSHEELTPQYRHAGVDIAVHPAWHGRGIGADATYTLAKYLISERDHHRLTIDPAADNGAAIRVYERLGFRRVGVMRQYERGLDGTWHDGLLMDMLADELTPPSTSPLLR